MTENLLLKLEEKTLALLSQMETLRNELKQLKQENAFLKAERISSLDKLKDLIQQLDAYSTPTFINKRELEEESVYA